MDAWIGMGVGGYIDASCSALSSGFISHLLCSFSHFACALFDEKGHGFQ